MATSSNNHRNRARRRVRHFTDTINANSVSTTVEIVSVIQPKLPVGLTDTQPGGTVVRIRYNLTELVELSTSQNAFKIWCVVGPEGATAADLPDPFTTGNLNQYADYLFVDEVQLAGSEVQDTAAYNPGGFGRWDIKAMRKLNDDESIFVVAKADAASARMSGVARVWWKETA